MASFVNKMIGVAIGFTVGVVMLVGLVWPMIQDATSDTSTVPDTWQTMLTVSGLLFVVIIVVFIARSIMSDRD